MKQKSAGAACWINHTLFERNGNCLLAHTLGEPIWCIVFAQVVTLGRINKVFVQPLQNVCVDVFKPETIRVTGNLHCEVATSGFKEDPIKEVTFDCSHDAKVSEGLPRQKRFTGRRQVIRQRGGRNGFCDNSKIGVLQEQEWRANVCPICDA
jgi:hypothetical protein